MRWVWSFACECVPVLCRSLVSSFCIAGLGELPDPAALEHVPLLDEAGETTPGMQANVGSHRASLGGTSGRSKREGHFSLAEHFPPVPPKLVQKIQAGEFVDLAELLPDNMEMVRRASIEGQGQSQRQLRRVVNLLTWVQRFSTYAAILGEAQPHRSRDLLAYMRLIVREANVTAARVGEAMMLSSESSPR